MKNITKINIITNDAFDKDNILSYISNREFNTHFDLKVGDKISYNTHILIYNEITKPCTITGTIQQIINYISEDEHVKQLCISVDDNVLGTICRDRDYYRKLVGIVNDPNTEIVDKDPETGDITIQTKPSDITFE